MAHEKDYSVGPNPILSTRGTRNGLLGQRKPHCKHPGHAKWIIRYAQNHILNTFSQIMSEFDLGGAIFGISDVDSIENKCFLLSGTVPFYGAPPQKRAAREGGDHSPPSGTSMECGYPTQRTRYKPRGGDATNGGGVFTTRVESSWRKIRLPGPRITPVPEPQQTEALLELSLTPSESCRHSQSHRSRQGGYPMLPPRQRLLHYLLEPL